MFQSKTKIWVSAPPAINSCGIRTPCIPKLGKPLLKCVLEMAFDVPDAERWLTKTLPSIIKQVESDTRIAGRRKWASPSYSMFVSSLPLISSVTNSLKRTRPLPKQGGGLLVAWGSKKAQSRKQNWKESNRLWLSIKARLDAQQALPLPNNYCNICGDIAVNNCTPENNCLKDARSN
jgi:hypothetical protein